MSYTRVYVRNAALQRVAELDDFESLKASPKTNDVGTWEIVCPADHPAALALTYLGGIEVVRDGQPFTSGPVTDLTVKSERVDTTGSGSRNREVLTASGVDDNVWLWNRLALPEWDGTPRDYDDHSGAAESVLRGFVDRNLGASALPERRLSPGLVQDADLGAGPGVRGRPDRYQRLGDFLQEIANGAGLTFRITQAGQQLVFSVRTPRDVSASVVFGLDRGNLRSYSYGTSAPKANHLYVAGTGDLAARLVVQREDAASVASFYRIEDFVDQNNVDDPVLLAQKGDEQLVADAFSSVLKLEPIDTLDTQFPRDYQLDDLVTVRLAGGAEIVDRVGQLALTVQSGSDSLTPAVASDGANLSGLNFVATLRSLSRRLARTESR